MVVVDLPRHLITPEGLQSILQAEVSLDRLGILSWLCEASVRQDSMEHPCVHDLLAWQDLCGSEKLVCGRQPFAIQALMCSRPSVVPGCGVLSTQGGVAGYWENRGLLR